MIFFIFYGFHPHSIAIYSPSESLYHFPRVQFESNFQILKGLLTKQIANKKNREGSMVTPIMVVTLLLLCKLAQFKRSTK